MTERQQWCERYRAQPNQKKRAAVFAKYSRVVEQQRYTVGSVSAKVTDIETTNDGGRITLTVGTPFGECSNSDVWVLNSPYHVENGSELYATIGELTEGDVVTVSLANVKPWHNDLQPEASVCGSRWLVQYTKVERLK